MNPTRDLKLPRALPGAGRVLSVDEVQRLLQAPGLNAVGLRNRALLELLYATGLRRGECHGLNLTDLDLSCGRLTVRRGKGGKARILPLISSAVETLARYLRAGRPSLALHPEEPALFLSNRGTRLSISSLMMIVAKASERAGLGRVAPHRLRHAFATHVLEGGADMVTLQALLGHACIGTTQIYTRLTQPGLVLETRRTHPGPEPHPLPQLIRIDTGRNPGLHGEEFTVDRITFEPGQPGGKAYL